MKSVKIQVSFDLLGEFFLDFKKAFSVLRIYIFMIQHIEGFRKAIDVFGKAINGFRKATGWSERLLRVQKGVWCQGFGNAIEGFKKAIEGFRESIEVSENI